MRRSWRWAVVFLLVVVVVMLLTARRTGQPTGKGFDPVAAARTRFEEVRGEGVDLSAGPCLGVIGPDWVADIAHDPREPVDDDPANQCAEYREGKVTHFVELTPEGKLIKVK